MHARLFVRSAITLLLSVIFIEGGHAFHNHHLTVLSSSSSIIHSYCGRCRRGVGIDHNSIRGRRNHSHHRTNNIPVPTILMMTKDEVPNCETTSTILYNIPNSGWKSPQWNWGSARGTGHDCAFICRSRWSNREDRNKLVHSLLSPVEYHAVLHPTSSNGEVSFEEIKLILALAWQRGRWDGTDGGPDGYRSILQNMADARRYENENEILSALHFIDDVSSKYHTICRNAEELHKMNDIANSVVHGKKHHASKEEIFMARRVCAGMVLDAMNFVDNGL